MKLNTAIALNTKYTYNNEKGALEFIEEKILELQMKKQDLTDMIISGDEGGLKELTSSQLDFILG